MISTLTTSRFYWSPKYNYKRKKKKNRGEKEEIFFFLATPQGLWELSSLTLDWTQALSSESMEF